MLFSSANFDDELAKKQPMKALYLFLQRQVEDALVDTVTRGATLKGAEAQNRAFNEEMQKLNEISWKEPVSSQTLEQMKQRIADANEDYKIKKKMLDTFVSKFFNEI